MQISHILTYNNYAVCQKIKIFIHVAYELVVLIVPTFSSRTCHRIQIQDVTQTSRVWRTTITVHTVHSYITYTSIHTYIHTHTNSNWSKIALQKIKKTQKSFITYTYIYNSFLYIYIQWLMQHCLAVRRRDRSIEGERKVVFESFGMRSLDC